MSTSTDLASPALAFARRHRTRFVGELKDFLRFPSVSSQPRHAADVEGCAAWLAAHLRRIGLERVGIFPTPRHPVVYAEWKNAPSSPTLLIYGHYDVVPPEPLESWSSPPFEPQIRDGALFARGACDDKGQMFIHLKALESWLRSSGRVPVNVKCIFEGEEEVGSPNLADFIARNTPALRADAAVISDTRMLGPRSPAISYAQRGVLSMELEASGPRHDLHSGNFGGAVHNPIQALCEIIASLHDRHGRVTIPGFYDDVREWSESERAYMARTGPSDEAILKNATVESAWGEKNYSLYERTTLRPALTVNGISGGYQGPGAKGIIPARASAKISFRLVPDQKPKEIERLVRRNIAHITPAAIRLSVRVTGRANPALVRRDHPALRAAQLAYRRGFGTRAVFVRSGGTIPVVNMFHEILGIPTVLMGFALPDDRIHAPDEKFRLRNFFGGVATSIWFLNAMTRV